MKILITVRGVPVTLLDDGSFSFGPVAWTVDGDGSPRCYGPAGTKGLDYLADAGGPGNWWGVAVDAFGRPYVQGVNAPAYDESTRGMYVSTTSYQRAHYGLNDPLRYLNSETERFLVVPGQLRKMVPGIVLGCRAEVINVETKQLVNAIVGDFGPGTHLGEGSVALSRDLHLNADPKSGGTDERKFIVRVYPGQAVPGYELQALAGA